MLARTEEALRNGNSGGDEERMNAIDGLLGAVSSGDSPAERASVGLIDFAGLFPPAALDMHSAARKYLEYSQSAYRRGLGKFIINLEQFPHLWDAAGDYVRGLPLSVVVTPGSVWDGLRRLLGSGYLRGRGEVNGAACAG